MKKNISTKLKDNGIPVSVSQESVSDIFGKRSGGTYEEGLVNSADPTSRLQNCKGV